MLDTRLAIFRTGQHQAVDGRTLNFTAADLQQIASSYDAANDGAPMVVGHPSIDAPAYGWAKGLVVEGDTLYAVPDQVDAQFAEMVNAGRFKKISSSVYMPDSPGNPKPGQYYLRHIGFLGAAAPAVKGLKAASFSESGAQYVEFSEPMIGLGAKVAAMFRAIRTHLAASSGTDLASVMPDEALASMENSSAATVANPAAFAEHDSPTEPTMSQQNAADFAEQQRQLTEQQTQLQAREQALAAREKKAQRQDVADFAEQLVAEGKLLPAEKSRVIELMLALPAANAPLSFAEGAETVTKPAGELFRELLTGLPKRIEYNRERSAGNGGHDNPAVDFAAPSNMHVDGSRLELMAKAKAYQASHPNTSFVDAVRACGG